MMGIRTVSEGRGFQEIAKCRWKDTGRQGSRYKDRDIHGTGEKQCREMGREMWGRDT